MLCLLIKVGRKGRKNIHRDVDEPLYAKSFLRRSSKRNYARGGRGGKKYKKGSNMPPLTNVPARVPIANQVYRHASQRAVVEQW